MKLQPHPQTPAQVAVAVAAEIERRDAMVVFTFSLSAPEGAVRLPAPAAAERADELWQTSCFEAFIRGEGESYAELNFSPSGQWAAYCFDGYRRGMRELEVGRAPRIELAGQDGQLGLIASLSLPGEYMRTGSATALSAVVEEVGGTRSYWALAHPEGAPDFHHPDCFVARLP